MTMETRKLYYEDCHLTHFSGKVLSCQETEKGWLVILDATAFYPEGGGQACDLGELGTARVLDVQEQGETVVHLCDAPLEVGATVEGTIDYARRFDLMQQHTGEHIISGIVHRRYGYHNTGFHVGSEVLTVDFDGVIPAEDLAAIEAEANEAVWRNLVLRCWYPSPEELPTVGYRTKRELPWPVRIVEIPEYDKCACCGIHVGATGEVGVIKIFSTMGFRGGTRMEMACGKRALDILNAAFDQNRQVSQAFSAKIMETGEAARRMNDMLNQEKFRCTGLQKQLLEGIAKDYVNHGEVLHFEDGLDPVLVRELADRIAEYCGGRAAVFSGTDAEGYSYCLAIRQGDLRELGKAMTAQLNGRGGGKPNFQQGRVSAGREQIEEFFRGREING